MVLSKEKRRKNQLLSICIATLLLVGMVFVPVSISAKAHASYVGQRFGYEDGHCYVEFDIYYKEDWNESDWTISPSSIAGKDLNVWANPTDGKLRVGIPGVGSVRLTTLSPEDFSATLKN